MAYYFFQSTTKTPQLVNCIKEVIVYVQSTGLQIFTTVCDQDGTNSAAIKLLKTETHTLCLQNGIENRHIGFKINNQEIIPLFDPPHLLKTIQNNLMTKDNKFYIAS